MQGAGWHSFPSNKNTFGLQASCLEIVIRMYSLELQIGGMKQYCHADIIAVWVVFTCRAVMRDIFNVGFWSERMKNE